MFPCQRLHVGDMPGSEPWGEFDHNAPAIEFNVKCILRIKGTPIAWFGRRQHVRHGRDISLDRLGSERGFQ